MRHPATSETSPPPGQHARHRRDRGPFTAVHSLAEP